MEEYAKEEYKDDTLTPLMMAAKNLDMTSLIQTIAYEPSTLNVQDHNGWTALMYASNAVGGLNDRFEYEYSLSIVQALLKAGADTLMRNHLGQKAVDVARTRSVMDMIEPYEQIQTEEREKILLDLGFPRGVTGDITKFLFRHKKPRKSNTKKLKRKSNVRKLKTRTTRKSNTRKSRR